MDNFSDNVIITIALLFCAALIFIVVTGVVMLCEIPERTLWNEAFETNYSAIEWYFAETTIKNYVHKGKQEVLNVNLKQGG